tara:strand:- start:205 stop:315 length:111 start_codon:yes stop_codon:yes gene_type:complete
MLRLLLIVLMLYGGQVANTPKKAVKKVKKPLTCMVF